jgi:hypothetical protein
MARSASREDVQDRILGQMDRTNRQNGDSRNGKVESLSEQMEKEAKYIALSAEDKLKQLSWGDWQRKVKSYLSERRITISEKAFNYATSRKKPEYEKFHQEGTELGEVADWLRKQDMYLMNY